MTFTYKGIEYAEGTRLKVKTRWNGIQEVTFKPHPYCCFSGPGFSDKLYVHNIEKYIVEITYPVYPEKKEPQPQCSIWTRTGSGSWQSDDEVFVGLVIYILAMIFFLFCKDRWTGWIGATIFFFMWKNNK